MERASGLSGDTESLDLSGICLTDNSALIDAMSIPEDSAPNERKVSSSSDDKMCELDSKEEQMLIQAIENDLIDSSSN